MEGILGFEDLDQLAPCTSCGSREFWFLDGWRCCDCQPCQFPDLIRAHLSRAEAIR
jgi:hypothetical protein